MIVIGIDPGIAIIGFGVVQCIRDNSRLLSYGVITTNKEFKTHERLKNIEMELTKLIEKYMPNAVAVEELFYFKNAKTIIPVAEARGVILLTAMNNNASLFEYTPLQIKQAITGYGSADKKQMQQMVKILLNLKEVPKPDDAADAVAVALCHIQSYKMNSYK